MASEAYTHRATSWWVGLIAGLTNVVIGVLLVVAPRRSLSALAWLAGAAIMVWGVPQAVAVAPTAGSI